MQKRLLWLVIALLVGGLIVLSSASVPQSIGTYGSPSYIFVHQLLVGVLPGVALMLILRRVPYRFWRKLALPGLVVALILLGLVLMPSLGLRFGGSRSWLSLGAFSFQPAEFLKLALVIYLAAWLGKGGERLQQWQFGLLPFALIMGAVGILLVLQPDVGTLGVVMAMAAGVYFVAGASWRQTAAIGAAALIMLASFAALSPERWSRVTTALDPGADTRGAGWQLNQSFIAIGAGGLWGVGLGESTQKFGFLPEPIGDSIFAVLAEELGFVGSMATLALFVALAVTLVGIARRAPDAYGSLLAVGMFMWISVQAGVNIAAITGLGPLTGIPLPFVSYGGTSMISLLAGMGIVLNVAGHEA